jgi:hypothetical protein
VVVAKWSHSGNIIIKSIVKICGTMTGATTQTVNTVLYLFLVPTKLFSASALAFEPQAVEDH